ncbi:MAG: hypothetical protein ACRD1B_00305 [Thermoanaerobaculia bacterium]
MIARFRTVNAILGSARLSHPVRKADLTRGSRVVVATENSVYSIEVLEDSTYSVRGGWFDRQGLSPARISIAGCTWGGTVIKNDIVAACGLHLEFGNRVVTTRIREIHVIRDSAPDSRGLVPADSRELLLACYGTRYHVSLNG